jgi:poly(beta-D-mannuronate) lyase
MCASTSRVEPFRTATSKRIRRTTQRRLALPGVAALLVVGIVNSLIASATQLRSPWDARHVTLTVAAYACPTIVHLSPNLTLDGYYTDHQSSIVDPQRWKAYSEASGPYRRLAKDIVDAADDYRATGSRAAANCALKLMTTAARDGVFAGSMSSRQAYYVQGWLTGAIAIAYLKVRDSGLPTDEDKSLLFPWLERVVAQTERFYDKSGAKNNHLYWAGVEVAAAGIAAGDKKLFNWGVAAYRAGVAQIGADGTMPLEMRRGRRALHYHLYALAPLVYLAAFGKANDLDLYSENHDALSRLVRFCIASEKDDSLIARVAEAPQEKQNGPPSADLVSWAVIWRAQFHDRKVSAYLARAASLSSLYLGGLPPGFESTLASER